MPPVLYQTDGRVRNYVMTLAGLTSHTSNMSLKHKSWKLPIKTAPPPMHLLYLRYKFRQSDSQLASALNKHQKQAHVAVKGDTMFQSLSLKHTAPSKAASWQ